METPPKTSPLKLRDPPPADNDAAASVKPVFSSQKAEDSAFQAVTNILDTFQSLKTNPDMNTGDLAGTGFYILENVGSIMRESGVTDPELGLALDLNELHVDEPGAPDTPSKDTGGKRSSRQNGQYGPKPSPAPYKEDEENGENGNKKGGKNKGGKNKGGKNKGGKNKGGKNKGGKKNEQKGNDGDEDEEMKDVDYQPPGVAEGSDKKEGGSDDEDSEEEDEDEDDMKVDATELADLEQQSSIFTAAMGAVASTEEEKANQLLASLSLIASNKRLSSDNRKFMTQSIQAFSKEKSLLPRLLDIFKRIATINYEVKKKDAKIYIMFLSPEQKVDLINFVCEYLVGTPAQDNILKLTGDMTHVDAKTGSSYANARKALRNSKNTKYPNTVRNFCFNLSKYLDTEPAAKGEKTLLSRFENLEHQVSTYLSYHAAIKLLTPDAIFKGSDDTRALQQAVLDHAGKAALDQGVGYATLLREMYGGMNGLTKPQFDKLINPMAGIALAVKMIHPGITVLLCNAFVNKLHRVNLKKLKPFLTIIKDQVPEIREICAQLDASIRRPFLRGSPLEYRTPQVGNWDTFLLELVGKKSTLPLSQDELRRNQALQDMDFKDAEEEVDDDDEDII